jgi:hypothetical protein
MLSQIEDEANPAVTATAQAREPPGGNRVFGALPNYRTAERIAGRHGADRP